MLNKMKFAREEYQEGRKVATSRCDFTGTAPTWPNEWMIGGWLLQQIATGKDRWAHRRKPRSHFALIHSRTGICKECLWAVFDSWARGASSHWLCKGFVENWKSRTKNKQLSERLWLVDFQNNHKLVHCYCLLLSVRTKHLKFLLIATKISSKAFWVKKKSP